MSKNNSGKDKVCVYHADCLDGFTSAWIVKQEFPDISFVEGKYHKKLNIEQFKDKHVIFVDFSTKAYTLCDIAEIAKSVLIIDHHASAEKELGMLGESLSNVEVVFDMTKSGAMLTWERYNDSPAPLIVKLVQDTDLWIFEYPETKPVMAYVRTLDQTFDVWDKLMEEDIEYMSKIGDVIYNAKQKDVKYLVDNNAFKTVVDGEEVLVANISSIFSSEAGHEMVSRFGKFSVIYSIATDGSYNYSFRANNEYDVSELATKLGGGGHPNAAGCSTDGPIWKTGSIKSLQEEKDNVIEARAKKLVDSKIAELGDIAKKMKQTTNILSVPDMDCLEYIGKQNGPRSAEATSEPIWLFQTKEEWVSPLWDEYFINSGSEHDHGLTDEEIWTLRVCEIWNTQSVFLSREEAESYGKSRQYDLGKDEWRVHCISLSRTSSTKYILSAIDIDNLEYRR